MIYSALPENQKPWRNL